MRYVSWDSMSRLHYIFLNKFQKRHFGSLQGCFRQSVTVVTIYASLGEDALVHSLNEVTFLLLLFFNFFQARELFSFFTRKQYLHLVNQLDEL